MSKTHFYKSPFITGTLFLTIAGVLTRMIGFFYRIFLSRMIGAEGLGIYQLVSPVMAIGFAVTAAGIQSAISKFVSMEIGRKNPSGARRYLMIGLVASLSLSALTGLFVWNYADFIATVWLGDARCAPLLLVLSFSFVPSCIHSCINGYYYGLRKTAIPSVCQLVEQLARVGSVFLMYQISINEQRQPTLSITMWGIVIGEVASTLVSVTAARLLPKKGDSSIRIITCAKNLFSMAIPLTANRVVLNFFASFEHVMIPNRLRAFGYTPSEALAVYGILTGMSMSVIMFPSVIANSVSVLLLPTISEAQAAGNSARIRHAIKKTIETCLTLGLICTTVFFLSGKYLGNTLFGNALSGTFIATLGWICPFLYLSATLNSVLQGLGYPGITFCLNLVGCGVRILFVLFAVPIWGIKSYLIGLLASQVVMAGSALIILKKKT